MEFQVSLCGECKFAKKCEPYRKVKKRINKIQRKLFTGGINLSMEINTIECDNFEDLSSDDNVLDSDEIDVIIDRLFGDEEEEDDE